mmetsp:Transcript_111714/g.315524  ORF Transcript_111714/g.315524 Transcript_111714/m.315524 type:complete len:275 (-) Transcript_111714:465-1289(-)
MLPLFVVGVSGAALSSRFVKAGDGCNWVAVGGLDDTTGGRFRSTIASLSSNSGAKEGLYPAVGEGACIGGPRSFPNAAAPSSAGRRAEDNDCRGILAPVSPPSRNSSAHVSGAGAGRALIGVWAPEGPGVAAAAFARKRFRRSSTFRLIRTRCASSSSCTKLCSKSPEEVSASMVVLCCSFAVCWASPAMTSVCGRLIFLKPVPGRAPSTVNTSAPPSFRHPVPGASPKPGAKGSACGSTSSKLVSKPLSSSKMYWASMRGSCHEEMPAAAFMK